MAAVVISRRDNRFAGFCQGGVRRDAQHSGALW
jgi:hypothetical protein